MALRSSFTLVLLLLSLQQLKWCKGEQQTTEVYEIDYKGPETHAFLPPPGHPRVAPSTGNKSKKPKAWKSLANDMVVDSADGTGWRKMKAFRYLARHSRVDDEGLKRCIDKFIY